MKICKNPKCNDRGTEYSDDMVFCPACNGILDVKYDKPIQARKPKLKPALLIKILVPVVAAALLAGAAFGIFKWVTGRGESGTEPRVGSTSQKNSSKGDEPWWDIYPTKISIQGPSTIGINDTQAMTVNYIEPKDVTIEKVLSWESSDTSVLKIDNEGKATGQKFGTAVITVVVEGKKKAHITATLSVRVAIPVASITINGATTLEQTQSDKLTAVVLPENATDKTVTWKSSNPTVATIDREGNIKALAIGSTEITASVSNDDKVAAVTVTVTEQIIHVTSILLAGPSSLVRGTTDTLTATVSPENATNKSVTYISSDSSVVQIDNNGRMTALKNGTATITAKADGISTTKSVKVFVPPSSITLRGPSSIGKGSHGYYLNVSVSPSDASKENITYQSSNTSVIRVDNNGEVWAQGNGTAQITAKSGGVTSNTISISVYAAVTGISIDYQNLSISDGDTDWFRVNVYPSNASNRGFNVKSENLLIATVVSKDESSGKVTIRGSNPGKTRIVVTTKDGNIVDYCYVTIY